MRFSFRDFGGFSLQTYTAIFHGIDLELNNFYIVI